MSTSTHLADALSSLFDRPARLSDDEVARIAVAVAAHLKPTLMAHADEWLTRDQAAALLNVSAATIDEWAAAGVLHPSKPTPRIVRYRRAELLALMERFR